MKRAREPSKPYGKFTGQETAGCQTKNMTEVLATAVRSAELE